jgi:hypothetical protein
MSSNIVTHSGLSITMEQRTTIDEEKRPSSLEGPHSPCPCLEHASFYHIGPCTLTPVRLVFRPLLIRLPPRGLLSSLQGSRGLP